MPFLTQGPEGKQASYGVNKTSWKYILIILLLSTLVAGGIIWRASLENKEKFSTKCFSLLGFWRSED